jgi:hypothetical protein
LCAVYPLLPKNPHGLVKGNFTMKTIAVALISTLAAFAAELPATNEVVARFLAQDAARRASISTYSVTTRYHLENKSHRADMLVRWTRQQNGVKQYQIITEEGDTGVRSHVFHRLLEAEVEASRSSEQERTWITPTNYTFQLTGKGNVNGREAYVMTLTPKIDAKFLTCGRIWIDAQDYAVIQVEGSPARNVSFWTKSVSFVQTFEKTGDFWFVAFNHSLTDARIFGLAELTIQYFDYKFEGRSAKTAD